ncbi:hypothetical protein F8M41_010110 [Gigaspora margarita]|uniref:Uncharacterized protein n=1 Tax=Gigaspora margarita TaxID=4874 RepID=A0A8H4AUJ3_GIGMA|nr:hypothetical protein F8M41_010110 [Gigaspora margarita]
MTSQIPQKRLKFTQCEPLNNKLLRDKATFFNFVDLISQIQKGTPASETTYSKLSSSTTNYEDDTLISNDDSTKILHVQPQSITFNTKGKSA